MTAKAVQTGAINAQTGASIVVGANNDFSGTNTLGMAAHSTSAHLLITPSSFTSRRSSSPTRCERRLSENPDDEDWPSTQR